MALKNCFVKVILQVSIVFFWIEFGFSQTSDTIPFTLTESNNIAIQVVFNDSDTIPLMFHTAVHGVSLNTEAIGRMSSIRLDDSANVRSWGGNAITGYSTHNTMQIGGLVWDSISITEGRRSGDKTDGKFGWDLFENSMLELNFSKNYLVVHEHDKDLSRGYFKLELSIDRGLMFIDGQVKITDSNYSNKFLVHSGYGGAVLFDDDFVERTGLNRLPTLSERELQDSYGNKLKTKKVQLPNFTLAEFEFSDIPAGIFEGAIANQKMSVLGGDLLKRFDYLFDFQNAKIYLKANDLFNSSYSSAS